MKILIAPDSFKGSLSALEFCEICKKTITLINPQIQYQTLPLADGGEGTLDALISALKGKKIEYFVQNSLFDEIYVPIGFFENGRSALIESAASNGLPLIKGHENPEETSTYGVGQMIGFAVDYGAKNITLTLGGSSTNDCGLGMLAALGACFYNKEGLSFVPTGKTLIDVVDFDFSMMYPRLVGARIDAICDVENPLCGPNGASKIFAPQKGADSQMVERLEKGCLHISNLFKTKLGKDFSMEKGAGAAGGMGFAVISAFKGKLKSGIDSVLDLCHFEEKLDSCDLIITGEGSFDRQSLMGKTIGGLIKRSRGLPVKIFCGSKKNNFTLPDNVEVFEISKGMSLDDAIKNAPANLEKAFKENLSKII